jgi:hypothetical protein
MGSVAYGLGQIGSALQAARESQRQDQIEKIKLALQQGQLGVSQQYAQANAQRLAMDQKREVQLEELRKAQIAEIMKKVNQSPPMVQKLKDAEAALGRPLNDSEKLSALGIKLPPPQKPSPYESELGKLQAEEEMFKKYPSLAKLLHPGRKEAGAAGVDERSITDKASDVESGFASLKDFPTKERGAIATYMREHKMQPGGKKTLTPQQDAGLRVLHVALWGDDKTPGLDSTVGVLDSSFSRKKMIAAGVGSTPNPNQWITTKLFHSGMYDTMSKEEKAFVYQLNRSISAINALRTITGLPRSTQQLMERYAMELPNPVVTPSSADARNQLKLVEREIRAAMAGGTPSGGEGDTVPGEQIEP